MTVQAEAPAWFRAALAEAPLHRSVHVDATRIAYRVWGPATAPGLVLLHGGGAHAGWWDHVAPLLAGRRVVAVDLAGHGDSGRRESYDLETWARDVLGVVAAEALVRPVVVGHSLGGWVSYALAARYADRLSGVVSIDSPLNDEAPSPSRLAERDKPLRVYADPADAVATFRTVPPQDVVLPYVRAHLVPASLRPVPGGWSWAFDPRFVGRREPVRALLAAVGCPAVLLRCQHGAVSDAVTAEVRRVAGERLRVVELPAAGHHPMLDQPLALVAALRTLLAVWPPAH